jgi:hypothetical protein
VGGAGDRQFWAIVFSLLYSIDRCTSCQDGTEILAPVRADVEANFDCDLIT